MATEKKEKAEAVETAEAPATPTRNKEEMVTVRLFKDGVKYKDDVFVAVNGKAYQIKRGVEVQVPRSVYDVLMQSMDQDQETADLITAETSRFKAEAAKAGL